MFISFFDSTISFCKTPRELKIFILSIGSEQLTVILFVAGLGDIKKIFPVSSVLLYPKERQETLVEVFL